MSALPLGAPPEKEFLGIASGASKKMVSLSAEMAHVTETPSSSESCVVGHANGQPRAQKQAREGGGGQRIGRGREHWQGARVDCHWQGAGKSRSTLAGGGGQE